MDIFWSTINTKLSFLRDFLSESSRSLYVFSAFYCNAFDLEFLFLLWIIILSLSCMVCLNFNNFCSCYTSLFNKKSYLSSLLTFRECFFVSIFFNITIWCLWKQTYWVNNGTLLLYYIIFCFFLRSFLDQISE